MMQIEQEILDKLVGLIEKSAIGDPERSMNHKEASEFLGIGERTLHRFREAGLVSAYKIGSRVLYRRTDLIAAREEFRQKLGRIAI